MSQDYQAGWDDAMAFTARQDSLWCWQPIETAPKDGTEVIAWGLFPGDYGYTESENGWTGVKWNRLSKEWQVTKPTPRYFQGFKPTHWIPRPAAPEAD